MSEINVDSLEGKTQHYWRDYDHENPETCLQRYIKELLPEEMKYARQREESKLPDETCDTLVLLVGFSIEPLLQAVYAYKPEKVFLVLNRRYGRGKPGKNWGKMIARLIRQLPKPPEVIAQDVIQAGPQQVYQTLLKHVRQTEGVIIDITGAKKNMVAGAFLYAALANVPVSYVDFADDAYDPKVGKPYGYACDIGTLDNPYEKFALRDWERVRQLYHRYKFRDARRLLVGEDGKESGTVLGTMKEYLPDSESAIRTLAEILRCYELWDAGLYNEAADQARKIEGFQPPTAVERLDGEWFEIGQAQFEGGLTEFYEDTPEFQAYVYDELARIDRLIRFNHDYRSAFLRAGSLNEVVMLARLVRLVDDDSQREALVASLQYRTPGAYSVFYNLRRSVGHSFQIGPTGNDEIHYDVCFQNAPEITVVITEQMDWWRNVPMFDHQGSWEQFINRRNDLAHKYYSPPRKWAEDALKFVQANVEDFWGADVGKDIETQAQPWSEVCKLTGLDDYLPPNLLGDVSD
ncbi:MAG: CRISPR-associated protein [Anaerolineae bacterium]